MSNIGDEAAIRQLVDDFVTGWNAGDGEACGRPFAEDADFTAITGLRAQGRDLIARGHSEILSTIYRGTQLTAVVNSIKFLGPDVASADVTLHFEGREPFGVKQTSLGLVVRKEGENWSIAVFRNMVPLERPAAGPLERERMPGFAVNPMEDHMATVTLINCFEVAAGREDEFFTLWQKVNAYMRTKPGYVRHALHRALAPDASFRFVNVAEWTSKADFEAAHDAGFRALVGQPAWAAFQNRPVLYEAVHVGQAQTLLVAS